MQIPAKLALHANSCSDRTDSLNFIKTGPAKLYLWTFFSRHLLTYTMIHNLVNLSGGSHLTSRSLEVQLGFVL